MAEDSKNIEDCPFLEDPPLTDVALVVEGKKLFVCKAILARASPVFKTMFWSNFKEKDAKEVPLPDKKHDDVVVFLKRIYPDLKQLLSIDIVIQVLPLFHEYDCKQQLSECEEFLTTTISTQNQHIDEDKILLCLMHSKLYGLHKAYKECLKIASCYSVPILCSSTIIKNMPDSVKADLFDRALQNLYRKTKETSLSIDDQITKAWKNLCQKCKHSEPIKDLQSLSYEFWKDYYY